VSFKYDFALSQIVCIVNDTGTGIKTEDQKTIFNLLNSNSGKTKTPAKRK
jgi:signal transduction histidine kinase